MKASVGQGVRKPELLYTAGEHKMAKPLLKTARRFLKKAKSVLNHNAQHPYVYSQKK